MTAQPPLPDTYQHGEMCSYNEDAYTWLRDKIIEVCNLTDDDDDDVAEVAIMLKALDTIPARIAAAEAATRRETIADVVMLLDREASTLFDRFMSYDLASSDGAAALRDVIQKVRALIPTDQEAPHD